MMDMIVRRTLERMRSIANGTVVDEITNQEELTEASTEDALPETDLQPQATGEQPVEVELEASEEQSQATNTDEQIEEPER
jgi:hypothetical protein